MRDTALALVSAERDRAEMLRASGQLRWTSADQDCPTEMWLAALMEELGEVARSVHDGSGELVELAQLAGVAVGRMESLLASGVQQ